MSTDTHVTAPQTPVYPSPEAAEQRVEADLVEAIRADLDQIAKLPAEEQNAAREQLLGLSAEQVSGKACLTCRATSGGVDLHSLGVTSSSGASYRICAGCAAALERIVKKVAEIHATRGGDLADAVREAVDSEVMS